MQNEWQLIQNQMPLTEMTPYITRKPLVEIIKIYTCVYLKRKISRDANYGQTVNLSYTVRILIVRSLYTYFQAIKLST